MKDEMDWRTEGTRANQRVEYLIAKANYWMYVTIAMAVLFIASCIALVLDLGPSGFITDSAVIALCGATWLGLVMMEVNIAKLKAWTEDE
jgi:hypothetical protein